MRAEVRPRRPAEETRKLAAEIEDAEPGLKQAEIAARLGISDRQLRSALKSASATPNPSTTPKETPS